MIETEATEDVVRGPGVAIESIENAAVKETEIVTGNVIVIEKEIAIESDTTVKRILESDHAAEIEIANVNEIASTERGAGRKGKYKSSH